MVKSELWRVDVSYACFGIVTSNGIVVEAAPIADWCIGKDFEVVAAYFCGKGGTVERVNSTAGKDEIVASLDAALDATMVYDYESMPRASNQPFCEREYVFHRLELFDPTTEGSFFGEACMEQGKALHLVVQRYLAKSEGLLFGDWICLACDTKYTARTSPVLCEQCNEFCNYDELSLEGLMTGHPDAVLIKFRALLEAKGSNHKTMARIAVNGPLWYHFLQGNFYLHAVNEKYKLDPPLDKLVFLYIDRGLPSNRLYFVRKPNRKVYDNTQVAIIRAEEHLHLKMLPPERICEDFQTGKTMGCAYYHVCFLPQNVLTDAITKRAK